MIKLRQLKVEVNHTANILSLIAKKLKVRDKDIISYEIVKESIDARDKNKIFYVYEINIEVKDEERILNNNKNNDITLADIKNLSLKIESKEELGDVIIVGSGPAGLFASYILSLNGYKPLIIEQGEDVDDRVKSVDKFFTTGILNPDSNVQFGIGGAGMFSDGKLHTLVKDKAGFINKVLKILVECGAPREILYCYKPHIGTDILRTVIRNMRDKIISMGGNFRFNTKLTNILVKDDKISSIEVNHKEVIPCDKLILAIGNGARDTFRMLYKNNIKMESKPFAVGLRLQHPQSLIDISQYGRKYKKLKKASYKLTFTTSKKRGVYSFCMCPGGYVINASSERGKLVVNGMSNYDRESINANSAIVVTVNKNDFGTNPIDGIVFQENLEKAAYDIASGKIPVQLYRDFLDNKVSTNFGSINPVFKGDYEFVNINAILPGYISESIKEAMIKFGTQIKGFDAGDVVIAGIESRTSSPIKIIRNADFECNIKGIYPTGEGAGYAGGITSSAIDGIKVSLSLINK